MFELLDPASIRARFANRSYWRLRYLDGRVVSEWEIDWSLAPQKGRQSLRLYCPDGRIAELGNDKDATGRLFQLKVATTGMGGPHETWAHLIGIVDGYYGECQYAAWDYAKRELVTGRDHILGMRYQNIGQLSLDVLGLSPV